MVICLHGFVPLICCKFYDNWNYLLLRIKFILEFIYKSEWQAIFIYDTSSTTNFLLVSEVLHDIVFYSEHQKTFNCVIHIVHTSLFSVLNSHTTELTAPTILCTALSYSMLLVKNSCLCSLYSCLVSGFKCTKELTNTTYWLI